MLVRQTVLLLLIVCGTLLVHEGSSARTSDGDDGFVDNVLAALTTRQRIGQLFIVGFTGSDASPEVQQFLADYSIGGVYLSRENCNIVNGAKYDPNRCAGSDQADPDAPAKLAALTASLQKASCDATSGSTEGSSYCLPAFVSVDHEGDDRPGTRLLSRFTPVPSAMAIGATFDPSQSEAIGCLVGKELGAVGVNMLLGPDVDVLDSPRSGGSGDQGIRTFGGDPRWVAEMAAHYIAGVHQCGEARVATVAKHFPGHGRSTRRVDVESENVVNKSLEQLETVDLHPFKTVTSGANVTDAIMTSHLGYTSIDGCVEKTPVTFDPGCMELFTNLAGLDPWRESGGLIMVDDIGAGAATSYAAKNHGSYQQGLLVLEALIAGADVVPLIRPSQWAGLPATVDYLAAHYDKNEKLRQRIDDAARAVLGLKARLYARLRPELVTGQPRPSGVVGQETATRTVESVVDHGLTFIKPASIEEYRRDISRPPAGDNLLFVECWEDPSCAPPNATDSLTYPPFWPRGKLRSLARTMFTELDASNLSTISFSQLGSLLGGQAGDDVRKAVNDANWIVFALLERDPLPGRYPDSEVLKQFLQTGGELRKGKKVVVFAYNSPYHLDAGELTNVDAFAALYTKIEPALATSLNVLFRPSLFSGQEARGSLPVDYDDVQYDLSDRLLPDPSQTIQLDFAPPKPTAGEGLTVKLAELIKDKNGHPVVDGTEVVFTFDSSSGDQKPLTSVTEDGFAEVTLPSTPAGELEVGVEVGDLKGSQRVAVAEAAAEPTATTSGPAERPGGDGVSLSQIGGLLSLIAATITIVGALSAMTAPGRAFWGRVRSRIPRMRR